MVELVLNFQNKTQTKYTTEQARSILINKLSNIKKNGIFEISVIICGARKIRSLNNKYRNLDKSTDVLSFGQDRIKIIKGQPTLLGDIVISVPNTQKNAKKNNHSFEQEMDDLLYHGLKHLLGYHHK
ncbi:MAG: rRNA maturation RNase YbeY [Patescibacteria group bacterium]|jgi:probable rRNA maturation factor